MHSSKVRMIYFYGPDGAGKTTHADLIALYLRSRGYRVWRTSVKHHHMLSYLFLKLISRNSSRHVVAYYGFSGELNRKIKMPWKILEFISLFLAIFYRVFFPLTLGYLVICDRYVLDSLVTLSYFLRDFSLLNGWLAKAMFSLIPRDSLLFWMDGDVRVLLSRKRDEPLSEHMLEYYRNSYRKLSNVLRARGFSIIYIDTTISDLKTTFTKVSGKVLERLYEKK